ncbi:hypothetical protein GZH53_12235 [Flavihumibacter sp. R14]|nr:hypothetical protein [Flavihumibacter soli]
MKIYFGVFALLFATTGCSQNENRETEVSNKAVVEETSVSATSDTLCYERYSGNRNQDTASIALVINDNTVTGSYENIPYQKDARKGTLSGIRSGDIIKGIWRFQQEGMNDSIPFEFKLDKEDLLQKPTSFDVTTGRETLADTASFSLKFTKIDCKAVNPRIR